MKKLDDAAHEWVFETNGHKWSNNDDTAGDNFSSFIEGAKWQQEQAKEMENQQSLKKIIYDLDELASEYSEGKSTSEVFKRAHESDFKAGFQKAIELLTFKTTEQ